MTHPNTVFLRLEGPLQAWGDNSKFVIRRCMDAPTKSGVLGLICCALGLSRQKARAKLAELRRLTMAVRVDRPGTRWWDYHTVGAGIGILQAAGGIKINAKTKEPETLVTRREYLCDASFLVALQGEPATISEVAGALHSPAWPLYLGRKCCPPAMPLLARPREGEPWSNPMPSEKALADSLAQLPWRPRLATEQPPDGGCSGFIEWRQQDGVAPDEAEVWYDNPVSFDPPVHEARLVLRRQIPVCVGEPLQRRTPPPPRPRADYQNSEYKRRRRERLERDYGLCVFCKNPAGTVQHVTYRRAGGDESLEDLRSLCRLCHDAVTMIEYGLGMALDRINPEDPRWRDRIIQKREEIIRWRSLETCRRRLSPEEV